MTPLDFFQEKIDMLKDERKMEEIDEINFLKTMMDKLDLSQEKVDKMNNEREELHKKLWKRETP